MICLEENFAELLHLLTQLLDIYFDQVGQVFKLIIPPFSPPRIIIEPGKPFLGEGVTCWFLRTSL